jgi:hypothetical protein
MVWDMVSGESFHRHIMTSGGTTATPARRVQLENESTFRAMPTTDTPEIQSIAMMGMLERTLHISSVGSGVK